MAPLTMLRQVLFILAILIFDFTNYSDAKNVILPITALSDPSCACDPVSKKFNETITDQVISDCRKCYVFTYKFRPEQVWAANLCVQSEKATIYSPLFVVVRESLSVTSFKVPLQFPEASPYSEVCHTLCPLANYKESKFQPLDQNISIEISTSSNNISIDFLLKLSIATDFVIVKEQALAVNITPSKPRVMEYTMEEGLRAVRIEATSNDESCMILAIQGIQCPIYDSVRTVEHEGYYQTMTKKSGISITRQTFDGGRLYVVLVLRPTNSKCKEPYEKQDIISNRQKEVMVRVIPSITDKEYYSAIFGVLGFYFLIYIFSFVICCFLFVRGRRHASELQNVNVENPAIQNYGTATDVENTASQSCVISSGVSQDSESSFETSTPVTLSDLPGRRSSSPTSFDEADMDKLPDAEIDKNVVRTKTIVFVSDLARKKDKYLSDRTKVYSWNLLIIAVFYGLPVVQLVYINQKIVNLTGNQDVCYYNFLCSHQTGVFSDFNHVYSNIGYVMLGILFLLLVCRREALCSDYDKQRRRVPQSELTGIPHHFGLMYAMGWALIMEGVLSASYHVCPNKANFQFDTAFMYVISTVCMLKLYQARHPDITAKAHTTWMVLSMFIIICVGGVLKGGWFFWLLFVCAHVTVTFIVSSKIYYMGRWKINRWIFKRMYRTVKMDLAARSFKPMYLGRFIVLGIAVVLNLALDLYGLITQPPNFGAFLLAVFIMNLLLYLMYYTIMKLRYREGIRWIPLMYMVLSFLCWGAALHFFLAKNTSWQVTPAESRMRNKPCIILNFFDDHDVWHFLSSCALFFSFMVLFTLDDDLETTPRSKIVVF